MKHLIEHAVMLLVSFVAAVVLGWLVADYFHRIVVAIHAVLANA